MPARYPSSLRRTVATSSIRLPSLDNIPRNNSVFQRTADMPIIWGFDLSEMHTSAFRSNKMFDKRWHLRRERFIVYQLAMLLGLAAECTATYSLSKYENQQTNIERLSGHTALVHNNALIDSAIVTIVFCVLVATVFGADFFFLLFFPRRLYPKWYTTSRNVLATIIALGMAIAAFTSTIIIARQSAWISGVSPSLAQQYLGVYSRPPLQYRRFAQNIAWLCLLWPAFFATVGSTYLMFRATAYDRRYGTDPAPSTGTDGDIQPIAQGIPRDSEKGMIDESKDRAGPARAGNSPAPQHA